MRQLFCVLLVCQALLVQEIAGQLDDGGASVAVSAGYIGFGGDDLGVFGSGAVVSAEAAYLPKPRLALFGAGLLAWIDHLGDDGRLATATVGARLEFPQGDSPWEPRIAFAGGPAWFWQGGSDGQGWVFGGAGGTSYGLGGGTALVAEVRLSFLSLDGDGDVITGVLDHPDGDQADGVLYGLTVGVQFKP